ncbi:MAG: peptidoglycan synthetase [Flavobacteriaceae bacterium]|jgi:UDP-N-acetylmuramate: L-alanyl-gamma-D-glutamyl-meso-diaminopimelate ligase|nr:peptidoglycan synthetase [Flavobacteriaceae bacterium]NVJ73307.1 peptidoglycan synthetase [Flavobacteriaceae bacterium]
MRVHFIAIGGSAMHNLALALQAKGDQVSGSDDVIFEPSKSRLEAVGLLPESFGWFEDKITSDIDMVVLGMHAKEDNPELKKALELGLNVYSYPEFLYEHSKSKTRVVIGGSHGKTTITSMILHVLNFWNKEVDYMVGAQLEGFDRMVHLTDTNEFIVLEGDEYLSSPIDRRPKFHLYQPNIALLSGIAWDHINVFPTFEDYKKQFSIFVDQIIDGGTLVYNAEDQVLSEVVLEKDHPIRKIPYHTPSYHLEGTQTYIETEEGDLPLEIFGAHNLNNLAGAQWICQLMGIDPMEFYEAITSFKGASKRLELVHENDQLTIFKDFAHAPSKVVATTNAVKEQYSNSNFIAVLELHTYSSLNQEFIVQYKDSLKAADRAIVFFDPHALKIKNMESISHDQIKKAFNDSELEVYDDPQQLAQMLYELQTQNATLLFMSSGNFGGLELTRIGRG